MPFGLTIGTERATALQNAIQDELIKRRYSQEPDPVMAEYITIMIINNKSSEQISSELEDLIGSDFERSFTDWLFAEAAKGEQPEPAAVPAPAETQRLSTSRDAPPHIDAARRNPPSGPRSGAPLYQQAINQATSNSSPNAQKRTASARSPSPGGQGPSKSRRTDVPSGPRAMREGRHSGPGPRSLLDRVGPARPHPNGFPHEEQMMMGGPGPFPPNMNEMDMNALAAAMQQQQMAGANPLMLQEMMMNQMALMAQMASTLGMLNPGMMGGFPMQGGMPDMSMMNNGGPMDRFQGHQEQNVGRGRGGPGGRGRGGRTPQARPQNIDAQSGAPANAQKDQPTPAPAPQVTTPTPQPVAPTPVPPTFAVPERPQSPTLCKFGLKCTNMHCRWSHPSPVATPESGVVLSNDPCEQGKNCKDKDCIKAHVSPAIANPSIAIDHTKLHPPPPPPPTNQIHSSQVLCRYGMHCTRRDCTFQHPPSHPLSKAASVSSQPCRFGAACTRTTCQYQHPEGRVLPTSFHRGVSTNAPLVNVPTPQTGSMSAPSPHKSVVFNSGSKADIERKIKELQEEKSRAEQKVKAAEAAAAGRKDPAGDSSVALAA
ncbi:hypothetical protein K488DRAFT_41726 [Vararia minispora EC-137]|uniref:Uncharacterized protein n=1 Tax=Vararia minispora EC-137 TaxID=1314806 RepID=A0ACB8QX94_9AGAM|nr:hypothetical protein K488DRAFT_41726 [Vararia minispora EC-137]